MAVVKVPVDIQLRIEAAIKEAGKAAEQISQQLRKVDRTAETTSKAVNAISFVTVTRAAIDFARTVSNALGTVINEAVKADDAMSSLANALRLSGDYSEQNVAAYQALADELSAISRFGGDVILSQVRVGKQFGLTNQEVGKLLRASVEYASFAGEDLQTVVQQLGQTFDGSVGRLGRMVPALKQLSEESLRSGAAVDLFLSRFSGSSQSNMNRFSAVLDQTTQRFGNVLRNLGNSVVQNQGVVEFVREIGEMFDGIAKSIEDSDGLLKGFVTTTLKTLIDSVGVLAQLFKFILTVLTSLKLFLDGIAAVLKFMIGPTIGLLTLDLEMITDSLNIVKTLKTYWGDTESRYNATAGAMDQISEKSAQISVNLEKIINQQLESVKVTRTQNKEFDNQINLNKTKIEQYAQLIAEQNHLNDLLKEEFNLRQGTLKSLQENVFGQPQRFQDTNRLGASYDVQQIIAQTMGVAAQLLRGREGAMNMVQQGAEFAGQALLGIPGFGQIIGLLAQGPDQVREMVRQFIDAVPDIVIAIVEAIPVLIETVIAKLLEGAERFINEIITNAPRMIERFVQELIRGAFQFVAGILTGAAGFVGKILEGAGRFIEEIVNRIGEGLRNLLGNLNPFGGSGTTQGRAGGALGGAAVGFAVGGPVGALVGGIAGAIFGKTDGESALNEPGSGFSKQPVFTSEDKQPVNVSLEINQRQLADVLVDMNRRGAIFSGITG